MKIMLVDLGFNVVDPLILYVGTRRIKILTLFGAILRKVQIYYLSFFLVF